MGGKIRARVRRTHNNCGMYYGQVYNEKKKEWEDVTNGCLTEWGAKLELKRWRKVHHPDEFEL